MRSIEKALRDRGVAAAIAALAPQLLSPALRPGAGSPHPNLDRLVSEVGAAFDAAGACAART